MSRRSIITQAVTNRRGGFSIKHILFFAIFPQPSLSKQLCTTAGRARRCHSLQALPCCKAIVEKTPAGLSPHSERVIARRERNPNGMACGCGCGCICHLSSPSQAAQDCAGTDGIRGTAGRGASSALRAWMAQRVSVFFFTAMLSA